MNRHSEIQEYKMMWCSIFISAIFTFCIGLVISVFVVDKLDVNYILQHFYRPITDFTAETQEKMQYILCTVSYPVIFL